MDRDAPPRVRPATPKAADPTAGKIRIDAAPGAAVPREKAVSVEQYWLDYYRTHDDRTRKLTASEALREKVALLNVNRKFRDVRAVLVGFLTYHPRSAEPWMYEALALAIKMNQGNGADVKQALGYAADLAVRSRNPNHLVSVADQLMLLGYLDRVGPLLDQAADLVPHRSEPLMMSINLARKTRDAKRMGDAVERLLALGWPGFDEVVRRDARKQAEALARELREDGKADEADALLARLPAAEARDLFVRLSWVGNADLDLVVEEPLGATAKMSAPRTVFGGSIVKNGYGTHPEEVYVCPRGFDGEYKVRVETIYNDPEKPALKARLELITHEGTPEEHKETHEVAIPSGIKASVPVTVKLTGGRRKRALPFLAPAVLAAPATGPGDGSRAAKPDAPALPEAAAGAAAAPKR